MKENLTVAGEISAKWIEEKLASQTDGDYDIYVRIEVVKEYKDRVEGMPITSAEKSLILGKITVKKRQLVNLD